MHASRAAREGAGPVIRGASFAFKGRGDTTPPIEKSYTREEISFVMEHPDQPPNPKSRFFLMGVYPVFVGTLNPLIFELVPTLAIRNETALFPHGICTGFGVVAPA